MAATSMRTSTVGLKLIKSFEGCLLNAYKDPVGIWTIGYGHTDSVFKGQVITMAEAEDFLRADLVHVETHIQRVLAITVSQNQFDALASFVFNVGTTAFSRSTLLRKLNQQDIAGAGAEFTKWVYAGKQRLPGLEKRRMAERELFLRATLLANTDENKSYENIRIYGVTNPDDFIHDC
jgi:lysozyme